MMSPHAAIETKRPMKVAIARAGLPRQKREKEYSTIHPPNRTGIIFVVRCGRVSRRAPAHEPLRLRSHHARAVVRLVMAVVDLHVVVDSAGMHHANEAALGVIGVRDGFGGVRGFSDENA